MQVQEIDEKQYVLSDLGVGQTLSINTDNLNDIVADVASWLTSGGRDFVDCNDVFNRGTEEQITALVAKFDGFSEWNAIAS